MNETLLYCILIGLAFLGGLALLEVLSRTTKLSAAFIRKAGHIGLMTVIVTVTYWLHKDLFGVVGISFAVIALALRQLPLKSLEAFKKSSYGEVFYPLGVGISALIAPTDQVFIIAVLILGLADTAAFVVGRSVRSPKIYANKTVAGSFGFIAVSALIIFLISGSIVAALVASPILAAIELFSKHGADNITVPVAASLLLYLLV